jgi:serine/threonine protein kinase
MENSSQPQEVGDRIGRYKILRKIAEGAFGSVYLTEQEGPARRQVALKIIKLDVYSSAVFEAERQALAMMDHPNIVKVLETGATETGRPYFVMELVPGVPIPRYCDQNSLTIEQRLKLFIPVCHAIHHAHQKGIFHRHLRPQLILVMVKDAVPIPKWINVGMTQTTLRQLNQTMPGIMQCAPVYISPEQALMTSLEIDPRSNVYSLGVVLYELLTGTVPFGQRELCVSLEEMCRIIRHKEAMTPSTRLSSLTAEVQTTIAKSRGTDAPQLIRLLRGDLDCIAMKCLQKDRTRRYETANDLAVELERYVNNEPVAARPLGLLDRFLKHVTGL